MVAYFVKSTIFENLNREITRKQYGEIKAMSGFAKINEGTVEIEHLSTASVIKITFTHQEQKSQQGETEGVITELWLEYAEFSDLKKAVNRTDNWL